MMPKWKRKQNVLYAFFTFFHNLSLIHCHAKQQSVPSLLPRHESIRSTLINTPHLDKYIKTHIMMYRVIKS